MSENNSQGSGDDVRGQTSSRVFWAIILIAVGAAFLLMEAGILEEGGNWWVIFLAIPGLALIWRAFTTYTKAGALTSEAIWQGAGGGGLILLTIIFIFDPDWSFTSNVNWDAIWPLALIVLGAVMLASLLWQRKD